MTDAAYQPKHFKPGEAPERRGGGIVVAYGHTAVGKTSFCVNTWDVATPLFFANFDRDASHILKQYKGEGGIYYDDFVALTKEQAIRNLEHLTGMKNAAMSKRQGVFVLDNFQAFYEMVQLAKLSGDDRKGALAYGPVNSFIRAFLFDLERTGIWCILTAPSREIWTTIISQSGNPTGQATGKFKPAGWGDVDYHAFSEIWLYTTQKVGASPQPQEGMPLDAEKGIYFPKQPETYDYYGQIRRSKHYTTVEGVIVKNPTLKAMLEIMKEIEVA